MKRVLLIVAIFMMLLGTYSCSTSKTEEQAALEYRVDSIAHIQAEKALQANQFVIMADRISLGKTGRMYTNPRPETNFVYVVNNEGVVQLAFENGRMGFNGLGGITIKGSVGTPKYKVDKNGNIRYSYSVVDGGATVMVDITLSASSDDAIAYVNSAFYGNRMVVYGKVQPYSGN